MIVVLPGQPDAVIGVPGFVGAWWHDAAMRYLVGVPNFGEFATPGVFAEVARRAAKLAREVATLGRLTGGRMSLGAGLGAAVADGYGSFGDTTDTRVLAE